MTVTIHVGDCIDGLRTLPAESAHCCVTSPPYYGLRSYLPDGHPDKTLEIGLQESPDEYIARLVQVFREVRRVLHPTGVVWLNIGDSYASSSTAQTTPVARGGRFGDGNGTGRKETGGDEITILNRPGLPRGMKPKDLMMIPARVALALQADGWWLRSDIIWHKPNAMPESVTDRPTTDYEHVFLLAKEARYFYDHDAIRDEPAGYERNGGSAPYTANGSTNHGIGSDTLHQMSNTGRNKRTVWSIPTKPYSAAHFATFPADLVEPMILAGTSERGACPECGCQWERVTERIRFDRAHTESELQDGIHERSSAKSLATKRQAYRAMGYESPPGPVTIGWQPTCDCGAEPVPAVVLDPFGGAGTTGLVADRLGRDAILIELNPEYASMAARRIYDDAGMFADVQIVEATP